MKDECSIVYANNYIYVSYHCSDGRLRYPTGVKKQDCPIPPTGKVANIMTLANNYITKHKFICEEIKECEIRSYLDAKLGKAKKVANGNSLLSDHQAMVAKMRSGELLKKRSKGRYSEESIRQFERMRDRWEDCAKDPKSKVILSYALDIDMFKRMLSWYVQKQYSQNSIYNIVNNLRIFLKFTYDNGLHTNKVWEHRDFSVPQEQSESIAPTFEELMQIYKSPCKTKIQEQARDLFVYGCFLALRVRDLSRINDYKLVGNMYEVLTHKTGKKVTIPCHWIAKEIYEKYNGQMPVFLRQSFARMLKEICKNAGISGPKLITITIGGVKTEKYYERYDLITPHSMRRFFATWMYVVLRRQPREIMPITGHESEASFFKYIKIESEINAQEIANDPAFKKPV